MWRWWVVALGSFFIAGPAVAQDDEVLVVAENEARLARLMEAVPSDAAVRWSGEVLEAEAVPASPTIEAVERVYLEGHFLRCIELTREARNDPDALLARGLRRPAGTILALRAACLDRERDRGASDALLRRLLVQGLTSSATARIFRGDLQMRLTQLQVEVDRHPPVRVRFESTPGGAIISLDGGARRCRAPCELEIQAGEHFIAASHPHRDTYLGSRRLVRSDSVQLRLPPFSPGRARAELARSMMEPAELVNRFGVLSRALGRGLVLTGWLGAGGATALLFDRRTGVVHRRARSDGLRSAVSEVLSEWHGEGSPPWWAWVLSATVLGLAAVGGVALGIALQQEPATQWTLRFR